MLTRSSDIHQTNLFGQDLLLQLDPDDPLLQLASAIPWQEFDQDFAVHYTSGIGAPGKPIRLMVGLLLLKQLEDLSGEEVVVQWKRNPYYQAFCGRRSFSKISRATVPSWCTFENGLAKTDLNRYFR